MSGLSSISWNVIMKWKEDDGPSHVRAENSGISSANVWNIEILEKLIEIRGGMKIYIFNISRDHLQIQISRALSRQELVRVHHAVIKVL